MNAARARTFAHTSTKFAVHVALLTHTDSRAILKGGNEARSESARISLGNFVRHREISFWELLIFEGGPTTPSSETHDKK